MLSAPKLGLSMIVDSGTHMRENKVSGSVVDAAYHIHRALGPGLLESVYEAVLAHELDMRGMKALRQVRVPIEWGAVSLDEGFRADLIVEDTVLVELKSVETIARVHKKQVLTYLRLTNLRLGLPINFGAARVKDGIFRIVNGMPDGHTE